MNACTRSSGLNVSPRPLIALSTHRSVIKASSQTQAVRTRAVTRAIPWSEFAHGLQQLELAAHGVVIGRKLQRNGSLLSKRLAMVPAGWLAKLLQRSWHPDRAIET